MLNSVDIGENKSLGNNAVDRKEAEMVEKAAKKDGGITSADIVKHETMEAYLTAKTGKSIVGPNSDNGPHNNNPYPGLFAQPDLKDPQKIYFLPSRGNAIYEITKKPDGGVRTTVNGTFYNGNITNVKRKK